MELNALLLVLRVRAAVVQAQSPVAVAKIGRGVCVVVMLDVRMAGSWEGVYSTDTAKWILLYESLAPVCT